MLIGVDFSNAVIKAGIVDQGRVVESIVADAPPDALPAEILDTIAFCKPIVKVSRLLSKTV